ncbi:hypothetical protein HPP92_014335 [Vanilla planifolia]|uniref:Uncharacterized protein n=1 Tax=Vanilla planifolia TaxID=51239 RepID=A0A835QWH9_VANPL|nr:hypothetical protein HPP92_014335 [Vanilla planifolia]
MAFSHVSSKQVKLRFKREFYSSPAVDGKSIIPYFRGVRPGPSGLQEGFGIVAAGKSSASSRDQKSCRLRWCNQLNPINGSLSTVPAIIGIVVIDSKNASNGFFVRWGHQPSSLPQTGPSRSVDDSRPCTPYSSCSQLSIFLVSVWTYPGSAQPFN